jgi:hypothetical protein
MLCVSLSTLCCAQTGDVVYVIDESVGMGPEHDWLHDFAVEVDTGLILGGVFNTRYALVAFGEADPAPYTVPIAGQDFGTAAGLQLVANELVTTGTTEDGYAAINHALFMLPFRPGVPVAIVLITDEDRDTISGFSYQSTLNNLQNAGAVLHVVVDAAYQQGNGVPAVGLDRKRRAYLPDGSGGVDIGAVGLVADAFGTTAPDYIELADEIGGAALDINTNRAGGDTQSTFTAALIDALVRHLNPPPCPPDVTTAGAGANDPGWGVPDGFVTGADLNYFVGTWITDGPDADVTTQGAGEGDPGFGVPDGIITGADLFFFVENWTAGCPD